MFNNWIFLWVDEKINEIIEHCEMSVISRCPIKFILFINPFFENGWVDWKRIEFEGLCGRKRNMKSFTFQWSCRGRANHEIHFFFSLVVGYGRCSANGSAKKRKQRRNEWMSEWWPAKQRTKWRQLNLSGSWSMKWNELSNGAHSIGWMKWRTKPFHGAARAATTNQLFFLPLREKKSGWLVDVGCLFLFLFVGYGRWPSPHNHSAPKS